MAILMAAGQSAPGGLMLRGRRDECATLGRLLDQARAGRSGTLVLRGEAGVGKTALLEHAVDSASDLTVLRASGVESEMELAFAALHQLCAPLLDRLDRLPRPQRDALEITFGLTEGSAPDRFFVGLAVLGLLSDAAEERPLLCVIDDAQWLDRASAQAFAFVARRLQAESVAMLFAAREPSDETARLTELVLDGLRGADARALLASVVPGRLDDRIVDELLAETRGNPLALLELPQGLTAAQLAGGFGLPAAVSLPRTDRGELPTASGGASRRHSAAVARGGSGPDRRSGPLLARCRAASDHRLGAGAGGIGWADPSRQQGPISTSARALGGVSGRRAGGSASGASRTGGGHGRADRS